MKDSGIEWIGEIPDDWNVVKIKYLFSIFGGSTPKSDNPIFWNGEITWITPSDMDDKKIVISSSLRTITEKGLESCGTHVVPQNSIILSTRAPIGAVNINGIPLCTNQGCKALVPNTQNCNSRYYFYYLSSQTDILNSMGSGTTFLELASSTLGNLSSPFPSIIKQTATAAFLDAKYASVNASIFCENAIIEKLKEYRQSIITEAVTKGLHDVPMKDSGIEWIGEIPENWICVHLRRITLNHKQGYYTEEGYQNEGVKLIRISDIDAYGMVNYDNMPYVPITKNDENIYGTKYGDFLFPRTGSINNFGMIQKNLERAVFASYLIRFRFSELTYAPFLRYYFVSKSFRTGIQLSLHGGVNQNIHAENIKNQYVVIPPILEQQEIAECLDNKCAAIDKLIAEKEQVIDKLEEYKKSLIYECVTGKRECREVA